MELRAFNWQVDELLNKAKLGESFLLEQNRQPVTKEPIQMLEEDGKYYDIEPGCEYHEVEAVLVPEGKFLSASVTLFGDDGLSVDEELMIPPISKGEKTTNPST